ncbi:MAG: hypothetical protein HQ509_07755 [Candidatus Marinimicrobia bacterium]|nr:hypothetical protein [Candidatus Neomarinimicrobiota bacterium]
MFENIKMSAAVLFASAIVGILGGYILFTNSVREEIRDIVYSDNYLSEVASKVNRYMIFDDQKIVSYDRHTLDLIEEFDIEWTTPKTGGSDFPGKITVFFKEYIKNEPLLSIVNNYNQNIKIQRGEFKNWIFILNRPISNSSEREPIRYKLELLD